MEENKVIQSELYTTEASESKAKAEAEAKQPDPEDAAEKFKEFLRSKNSESAAKCQ